MARGHPLPITVCVSALEYGGVDSVVHALATGLDRSRYNVTVYSLGPDHGAGDRYRAAGIQVVAGEQSGSDRVRAVHRLWRFLHGHRVMLVHTNPGFGSRVAALLARVPVVVATYHGSWAHSASRAELLLRRFLDRRATAVVANSRFTRDHVIAELGVPPERVRVIHNGVDLNRFRPPSLDRRNATRTALGLGADDVVVATVARLYPDKGVWDVVSALALARAEGVPLRALIVGDGPEGESLRAHVATIGVAPHVQFVGARSDIPELLAAADLFVLASRTREGFGIALAEAMAMSLPVVGTFVEGIPELVEEGRTGLLVPPCDPSALADAFLKLVREPKLRHELGTRGRATVESRFDARRMVAAYAALYEELLGRSPHASSLLIP